MTEEETKLEALSEVKQTFENLYRTIELLNESQLLTHKKLDEILFALGKRE